MVEHTTWMLVRSHPEALQELGSKKSQSAIGLVAFDGDVDENGEIVDGDKIVYITV